MNLNTLSARMPSCAASLVDSVGFDLLGDLLGCEVESALEAALEARVAFPSGSDSLEIYRSALKASIRDIEGDERGKLFQRFLRDGPYEGEGEIPFELRGRRLTDGETYTDIELEGLRVHMADWDSPPIEVLPLLSQHNYLDFWGHIKPRSLTESNFDVSGIISGWLNKPPMSQAWARFRNKMQIRGNEVTR